MNGHTVRTVQLPWGSLSETEHRPASIPLHAHELASFCLVLEGRFHERLGGEEKTFEKRGIIFRAAGQLHSDIFEAPRSRCFNVLFDAALLARSGGSHRPDLSAASPILARILRQSRGGGSILTSEGLVLQLIGEVFRPAAVPRPLVVETERIIARRFTEPLTVSGIAAELSTHPVHLSRTFRIERGIGITDAIRALRIAYAVELLDDDRLTLADVALRAGFADQSHFTKVFRKEMQRTPGEYRRPLRPR
jgi:AraC-like DNA-binding protein